MSLCWARSLGGCAGGMSGEHPITEGIFRDKEIGVHGLPWCREEHKFIRMSAYRANILCRQHNSDLSPVDDAAIHFFSSLRTVDTVHQERRSLLEERMWAGRFELHDYTIDGEKLERWFLKTLINMEVVGKQLLPIGAPGGPPGEPPSELVEIAFGRGSFEGSTGLYLAAPEQSKFQISDRIRYVSCIADSPPHGEFVAAGEFVAFGFQFFLPLESTSAKRAEQMKLIHHIREINIGLNGEPSQRVLFSWP